LLLVLSFAAEARPAVLRVRQAIYESPVLTVYADLQDDAGKRFEPAAGGKFSAALSGQAVNVEEWGAFSWQDEGITSVFLVDISASIKPKRFEELKKTISAMINNMPSHDRAAILTFGEKVTLEQDFTAEKKSLLYSIQNLQPKDQYTQLNQSLIRGQNLARIKKEGLPRRRVIILCSDGMDDMPGGATQDEVREAMSVDPVPVYSIFFDDDKMSRAARDTALKAIGEHSRMSGGELYDAKSSAFDGIFKSLSETLNGSLVFKINLGDFKTDGTPKRIEITYSDGEVMLSDGINIRIESHGEPDEALLVEVGGSRGETEVEDGDIPFYMKWKEYWLYIAAGITAVLAGVIGLFYHSKKKRAALRKIKEEETPPAATVYLPKMQPTTPLPGSPVMEIELIKSGTSAPQGEKIEAKISGRLVLGRKPDQGALAIPGDGTISSRHCELIFSHGKLFVADLQSTNGTYVNGVEINGEFPLNDGDRLLLGKSEFRVRIVRVS